MFFPSLHVLSDDPASLRLNVHLLSRVTEFRIILIFFQYFVEFFLTNNRVIPQTPSCPVFVN